MLLVCEPQKSRGSSGTVSDCDTNDNMNANEARLRVHGAITDVLVAMAVDDDATDEEIDALEEQMSELADVIMEDIGLEVTSVNEDKSINAVLRLFTDEELDETA